ncbi:hypothetical protein OGATHE_006753 [Ogataea polymorpha]|uniref:Uncharacterized protein n=1 Tax=Ogataea polymorpha TaxID=460523 RepID=A0A9P8NST4_9ASCO|nr:hypothetical protein OGATHE_006753 [Ogataea polymorpha]
MKMSLKKFILTFIPSSLQLSIQPVRTSPTTGLKTTMRNRTLINTAPSPGLSKPSSTCRRSQTATTNPSLWMTLLAVRNGSSEDDQVQQGVGTQTVGSVHRGAGSLTTCEETWNHDVLTLFVLRKNLSRVLSWDTTHVVVHSWQNWNWLLGDVDTCENVGSLRNTWESLLQHRWRQVGQLKEHVVFVRAHTPSGVDFHGDGSRNNVSRSKILGSWSVSFHESLTLAVHQESTLTSGTLGDQTSRTINTRWVELHKLQILQWQASSADHGVSITSTGVSRGTREVGSTISTSGNDCVVSLESVQSTVLLVVSNASHTSSVVHQQVHGKELDEVVGVVSERLTVQCVQQCMSGSVRNGTGSVSLSSLTKLLGLTTKSSLIDLSLLVSGEGQTVVFKLNNRVWSLSGHVVDSVLVTKPIGTFHCVIHVPSPFVRVHVSQGRINTTLSSNGVRSCWKKLRDAGDLEALLDKTEGCTKTGTTGTNHHSIVLVIDDVIFLGHGRRSRFAIEIIVLELTEEKPRANGISRICNFGYGVSIAGTQTGVGPHAQPKLNLTRLITLCDSWSRICSCLSGCFCDKRTKSHELKARSDPEPMATPMSAVASAGASLMPSPTIATTAGFVGLFGTPWYVCCNHLILSDLP